MKNLICLIGKTDNNLFGYHKFMKPVTVILKYSIMMEMNI